MVAANLTSKRYQVWPKKNFYNYISVHIDTEFIHLFNRDKKNIYNNKKNIVGLNIKYDKPGNSNIYINNNSSKKKFLSNILIINNYIKNKKIIFD